MFGFARHPQLSTPHLFPPVNSPQPKYTEHLPSRTFIQALIYIQLIGYLIIFCFLPSSGLPYHHHGCSVARGLKTLNQPPDHRTFPFEALLPSE